MEYFHQLIVAYNQLTPQDWAALGAIVLLDIALSMDNAIVINSIAMGLSTKRKQNIAIWAGMALAIVLRGIALYGSVFLMQNPSLQLLGGLFLVYLFYKHYIKKEEAETKKSAAKLLSVILIIGAVDLSLSIDNVIGVVAMSKVFLVIATGVVLSIGLLTVSTQLVRIVMRNYPYLQHAGFVILLYLGVITVCGTAAGTAIQTGELLSYFGSDIGKVILKSRGVIETYQFHVGEATTVGVVIMIIITTIVTQHFSLRNKKSRRGE